MASLLNPFRSSYRLLNQYAHDKPVLFYSVVLGFVGPIMAVSVPPIRESFFGYIPAEQVPTAYPLPKRPRRQLEGYDDE